MLAPMLFAPPLACTWVAAAQIHAMASSLMKIITALGMLLGVHGGEAKPLGVRKRECLSAYEGTVVGAGG